MNRGRIRRKLEGVRKRAIKANVPYDLTIDWYVEKLAAGHCEITGIPFVLDPYKPGKGTPPFIPSIDRTVPSEGYTKKNCRLVIMIYNQIKNEYNPEDILVWGKEFIKRFEDEVMLG